MKAVMLNKKLWTNVTMQELETSPLSNPDFHVVPGCGGCGCGCCCPYLCVAVIC